MESPVQLRLMVDTNVWIDRFVPGRPKADVAQRFFARCSADDVLLLCPPHAPQDLFFVVQRDAKQWIRQQKGELTEAWAKAINEHAWEQVHQMLEVGTAAAMGPADIWLAQKYRELHSDFEDDIVIAVAQRVKADYLVTSDKRLIAKSPVAALAPEDMLTVLKARE